MLDITLDINHQPSNQAALAAVASGMIFNGHGILWKVAAFSFFWWILLGPLFLGFFLSVKFQGVIAVLHGMKQQLVFLRTPNVCNTTYIRDI